MADVAPRISIIIATYCSGVGLQRVIDSLDAQTMPQNEFEVIFVDDGSPDETFEQLQVLEADRENVRAFRIDNSGWPSKPRNVGIEKARGEYLIFMDHDDSLFPDGLRRAYEYATETGADLLSPKESKTNDKWWGMSSLRAGNLPNIAHEDGIKHLLPLVPHKLYRRSMFIEHDIRFPEGSRVLWEDQFINVDAYRHSNVVAVLADSPLYLWHASSTNSSHTFDPVREDFWDRLEDLMAHIDKTLNGKEYRDARRVLLEMHLRVRIIDRMVRLLARGDESGRDDRAMHRARKLLKKYGKRDVIDALPRKHQIQARFLKRGRKDLLVGFHEQDLAANTSVRISSMNWENGALKLDVETLYEPKDRDRPVLRQQGGRTLLALPSALSKRIPNRLLDVTEEVQSMSVEFVLRSRRGYVTWSIPSQVTGAEFFQGERGISLRTVSTVTIDISRAAVGNPLEDNVWDLHAETDWLGMMRLKPVLYNGNPQPALVSGRQAIPYCNNSGSLSLDLAGWLRTLASDAAPKSGSIGTIDALVVPLENLSVFGDCKFVAVQLLAISESEEESTEPELNLDVAGRLGHSLHAELGEIGHSSVLKAALNVEPGTYRLFADRDGRLYRLRHSLVVKDDSTVDWHIDE